MGPFSQHIPYKLRGLFQLFFVGFVRVARPEPQPEAVPVVAWEDVQVDVEDVLAHRRPEID